MQGGPQQDKGPQETQNNNITTLSQLKHNDSSRKTRVVFGTVAIGLGVNIPDVRQIFHIGVPCTLESNKLGMTEEMHIFCLEDSGCLRNTILKYLGLQYNNLLVYPKRGFQN